MDILTRIRAVNDAANVDTKKETDLYHVKRNIDRHFKDSTDYESSVVISGRNQEAIVSNYKQSLNEKLIRSRPNETFNLGDLVEVYNSFWLVTEIDPNKQVYTRGKMEQCNRQISWQNPETLDIITRWCTVAKPYFSNLEDIRQAEISTREFKIQIPYDSETSLIDLNKRFLMEKIGNAAKSYRVTSVDTMTERYSLDGQITGFLVWNVEQDQFNPNTDSVDLMIADYISPTPLPPVPSEVHAEFQYTGDAEIKQGNSRYKEFVAVVMDVTGVPVSGAVADMSYELAVPELAQYIYVEIEPGRIRIKADSQAPIGTVISLVASYGGNEIGSLTVKVVGIY